MTLNRLGAALGLLAVLNLCAAPAWADNYDAKDGNGQHQSFAAKLVSGILHPFHIMEGMFSGNPVPLAVDGSGNLQTHESGTGNVNCLSGCGGAPFRPDPSGATAFGTTSTSSTTQAFPGTAGTTVGIVNTGGVPSCFRVGTGTLTASASTDTCLPPGIGLYVPVGTDTEVAAITASGSGQLTIIRGVGGSGTFIWQNLAASSAVSIDQTTPGTTDSVTVKASDTHKGEVGGNQLTVTVAQTVTASSAYTSGNAIGGLMTIASAARVSATAGNPGTSGLLQSVVAKMKSSQTTQIDVFIFNANPSGSTCTDKTAFALAAADLPKLVDVVSIVATTAWYSGGSTSVGRSPTLAVPYVLNSATSLFACAVTRATPTYASTSDVSFDFGLIRN